MKHSFLKGMGFLLAVVLLLGLGCLAAFAEEEVSADGAIRNVTAIGFVDLDGVKLRAVP